MGIWGLGKAELESKDVFFFLLILSVLYKHPASFFV